MKKWLSFENGIVALLVALPILFNLYLLAPELNILSDVNDNVFAYALALRMNQAWDEGNCPLNLFTCLPKLTDHWVSYWAMGYPLPHYYQHLPSIINVALFKILAGLGIVPNTTTALDANILNTKYLIPDTNYHLPSLFIVFNWIKYLLLSFFPLAIYWSARKFRFPKLAAAFAALASTLISTNFQYGTDYNALIWRGSGMYTQLWGMFFLPLAVASIYESLTKSTFCGEAIKIFLSGQKQFLWPTSAKLPKIPHLFRSVLLLALTFHSHVLFGYIAVFSSGLILLCLIIQYLIVNGLRTRIKDDKINNPLSLQGVIDVALNIIKLLTNPLILLLSIFTLTFLSLAYWLIPLLKNDAYHAHSVWDELYKFNSFGAREVINRWLDGAIFDFGRFPILTILVFVGFFYALNQFFSHLSTLEIPPSNPKYKILNTKYLIPPSYLLFPTLLVFWTLMYFGRTTWGSLINLLPASEGIHMHRFINGIHFAGIFLIGLGLYWLSEKAQILASKGVALVSLLQNLPENPQQNINYNIKSYLSKVDHQKKSSTCYLLTCYLLPIIILFPAIKERYLFLKENTNLLTYYNNEYKKDWPDLAKTLIEIEKLQKQKVGRIWAGRPGNWGRNFKVGGTEVYLALSVNGLDSLGFEPESWSPNTDTEQFFNESRLDHYNLFNLRYIIAPPEQKVPDFAKKITTYGKYNLYAVETNGNFDFITSDMLVFGNKFNTLNFNRFWLESNWVETKSHPLLSYNKPYQDSNYNINILLTDWVSYKIMPNNSTLPLSLLSQNPFSATPAAYKPVGKILSEKTENDFFEAKVKTDNDGLLMLKTTFHPYWHAYIKSPASSFKLPASITMVSPYFLAVKVPTGTHTVEFRYEAQTSKKLLLVLSLATLILTLIISRLFEKSSFKDQND